MNILEKKEDKTDNISNLIVFKEAINKRNNKFKTADPFWIARNFNLYLRKPLQWNIKRIIDLTGSIIGLILLSPVLILLAVIIKLDSRGPVLFRQKRIGLYGKEFYMYKFRSMKQNAENDFEYIKSFNETNDVMFKMVEDPRITRIGKIIRKFSLDELPQLFNVIKGEMSLVGPRPPLRSETEKYKKWHYLRFATLPGLTGIWQVSGRAKIQDFNEVVKLDYKYIENWSLKLDFYLLLKTIPVVISAKGAA